MCERVKYYEGGEMFRSDIYVEFSVGVNLFAVVMDPTERAPLQTVRFVLLIFLPFTASALLMTLRPFDYIRLTRSVDCTRLTGPV